MDIAIIEESMKFWGGGFIHRHWLHASKGEGEDSSLSNRSMRGRNVTKEEGVRNSDKETFLMFKYIILLMFIGPCIIVIVEE